MEGRYLFHIRENRCLLIIRCVGLDTWKRNSRKPNFYFPWIRKIMGPLLILVGLYMVGLIKLPPFGSFMLGFSFSLAFCPTMFILFFVTLMPIVLSSYYGFILPSIFAFGTALPLILFIFII